MDKKIGLVFGCNGQDGSYLLELLLGKGYKVHGVIRRSSVDTTERIAHLISNHNLELVEGDITDAACIHRLISGIKPDEIYNLAAMSDVGVSFDQPITTCQINAVGPLNILEAIRQSSPLSKFYQASTSEIFGNTYSVPQSETTPMIPNSPYAIAKLCAHQLVGLYRRSYNIFACAGILFNHESPRRGENFVTRKITRYVAKLSMILNECDTSAVRSFPKLRLGNINAKRDWSHAGDMVRGMWMILQHKIPDDYILGSGKSRSVKELLRVAFGTIESNYEDYVVIDSRFYRPADINDLCADTTKARKVLGWEPIISFDEMIGQMITNDCEKLKGKKFNA